jgi:Uma2 family endonuclease
MAAKAQRYLAAGVRLVWIIWPRSQQVDLWLPGDTKPATTYTAADMLDGRDIVPGFVYPIAELFA